MKGSAAIRAVAQEWIPSKGFTHTSVRLSWHNCVHLLVLLSIVISVLTLQAIVPSKAHAGFIYNPISESILSATFSGDFAALIAHRTVAGFEVNHVTLIDPFGHLPDLDLSNDFFGAAELLLGETPKINQGSLETGIFSASIPSVFFPVLQGGLVGLSFLATDTDDGLFAMDFLSLNIETPSGPVTSFIDTNNGFGIGLPDNGTLIAPLPISIPIGATGRGFDESISSKSINEVPVPEPATIVLFSMGLGLLLLYCRRTCGPSGGFQEGNAITITPIG